MKNWDSAKLRIEKVKSQETGYIKANVFKTFNLVLSKSRLSTMPFFLGCLIDLLTMMSILLSLAPSQNWRFEFLYSIQSALDYITAKALLQLFNPLLNLAVLIVILTHHALFLGFILYFRRKLAKTTQVVISRYIGFYYSFISIGFAISFYLMMISQLYCKSTTYNRQCWSGLQLVSAPIAGLALLFHIIIEGMGLLYFHIANPAIRAPMNGSSKIYVVVIKIEKIIYALYCLIRIGDSSDKQFLIFMLLVCLVKVYEHLMLDPFYDVYLNRIFVCAEGIHFYMIVSIALVVFLEEGQTNPISFITSILGAVLFGLAYQFFIENSFFGNYERLRLGTTSDSEMVELSTLFISCLNNVRNGPKYRRILQRILFEKRLQNKVVSKMNALKGLDFMEEKEDVLVQLLAKFWKSELEQNLIESPNNTTLLLHRLFLSLIYTDEIYSILQAYKKLEALEASFLNQFEVFLLKKAVRSKINFSNLAYTHLKKEVYLASLLHGQNMIDQIQTKMENLLSRLFSFWEDLSIIPHKYSKNLNAAYQITVQVVKLRVHIEELLKIHQDEKLCRIYLSLMKIIGFPTFSLRKALTKIKLKSADLFIEKHQERRFRSFNINDRKVAIIVSNLYRDGNGTIVYSSHTTREVINIDTCDLKDANLKSIMPDCYKQLHSQMVSRFFVKQDHINHKNRTFVIYTLDFDSIMRLSIAHIKIFPYVQSNIRYVR